MTIWWPETDSLGVPHLTNAVTAWVEGSCVAGECVLCAGRRQVALTYLDRLAASGGQPVQAPWLCLEHGLLVRRIAPPTAQASIWAAELDAVRARAHPGHLARRPYGDSQECAVCGFERDFVARLVLALAKWLATPSGHSMAFAHPWMLCVHRAMEAMRSGNLVTAFRLSPRSSMAHFLCQTHGNAMDAERRHYLYRNVNTEAVSWPQDCPVCALEAWQRADENLRIEARTLAYSLIYGP
jgi:hypothetical protein